MAVTKISSREFNQDLSRAKRAAKKGPVVITDRGEPAYVLMRHDAYKRLAGGKKSLLDRLYLQGAEKIELDLPPRDDVKFRDVNLS
jgi:prevent-host-death family protein